MESSGPSKVDGNTAREVKSIETPTRERDLYDTKLKAQLASQPVARVSSIDSKLVIQLKKMALIG